MCSTGVGGGEGEEGVIYTNNNCTNTQTKEFTIQGATKREGTRGGRKNSNSSNTDRHVVDSNLV